MRQSIDLLNYIYIYVCVCVCVCVCMCVCVCVEGVREYVYYFE